MYTGVGRRRSFSTEEKLALVASILYNRLYDHEFDKPALLTTLKAINAAIDGDFVYRRSTGKKHLRILTEK